MERTTFLSIVNGDNHEVMTENANMNSITPSGMMYKLASETSKEHTTDELLSHEAAWAVKGNYIHIHDLDYYPTKSLTCLQHPLDKILQNGFRAGHGSSRPAKRIETATMLACISMETIQNEMHGGQSFPAFDFYLAPYVRKTYIEELDKISKITGRDYSKYYNEPITDYMESDLNNPIAIAITNTVKRVHQAMESFVHNSNTIHSRGGNQVVFSSINYGTDTSAEGRCIIRELLNTTYRGVGNGETPIFPIQIFKLKKGVNTNPEDRNYDLFKLACKVTARRFFPNFVNLDAPFNYHDKWRADDPERYKYEVATMGCRTRVFDDRFGEKTTIGRGNLSFTTVNLVKLALQSNGSVTKFKQLVNTYVGVAVRQLVKRFEWQCTATKSQFPLLMNGMWLDSEKDIPMRDIIKHGTLSVGFIGLAEALIVLTGKHHGEDENAQLLGLSVVKLMDEQCKMWSDHYNLNISLIATPAEGLSGKFVKRDREDFGIIPNVTDKEYYTNSNHVPVWYKCTMEHKLAVEAPYHQYTPAGHIAYLEVDGDPERNVLAVEQMVNLMRKYHVGYGSINHARARCLDCGHEDGGDMFTVCPKCGSENVDVLERITGNPD